MAEAAHYHERLTSQVSETSSTPTTKLTVSAADLSSFAANDVVFIFAWVLVATASNQTFPIVDITYNGTVLHGTRLLYDPGTGSVERVLFFMDQVDLGATIADFDIDLGSNDNTNAAYLEKVEVLIVDSADFGIENTDWFWDKVTTDQSLTTSWVNTNQASITWTPSAVEDWIVISTNHHAVNTGTDNHEYRLNLDSGTILGNTQSEEGEATAEEKVTLMFEILESLSTSSHTMDNETRMDLGTGGVTRESRLLIFRKDIWADIYFHERGTLSVTNDTDVQVATVTDALSTAQNVVMLGQSSFDLDNSGQDFYIWIRQDGSTVIDPTTDFSGGLSSGRTYDASDVSQGTILAYKNLTGTLDLDLFVHQVTGGGKDSFTTKFLVWGMELAAAGATPSLVIRPNQYGARLAM